MNSVVNEALLHAYLAPKGDGQNSASVRESATEHVLSMRRTARRSRAGQDRGVAQRQSGGFIRRRSWVQVPSPLHCARSLRRKTPLVHEGRCRGEPAEHAIVG